MIKACLLVVGLAVCGWATQSAAQVNRPPCRHVLGEVTKEVNARGGRPASPRAVAHAMGIEPEWVLRCMEAYGRTPAERSSISDADREAFDKALEEGRPVDMSEDEKPELEYQKQQELKAERQEMRKRRKELAKEKEFDDMADFSFRMNEY